MPTVAPARAAGAALDTLRASRAEIRMHVPTGFHPLDDVLSGGLRPGELMVLGGQPGVGKTVASLQWARSVAMSGLVAVFVTYEHGERDVLERLLHLELGAQDAEGDRRPAVAADPSAIDRAMARVRSYADRLLLVQASPSSTGVAAIEDVVGAEGDEAAVVFVDSLQKVPPMTGNVGGDEAVHEVAGGLKALALTRHVAVVAVSSTCRSGLVTPRVRLHHLKGAEAIAYEADIVMMLNEKSRAVSEAHRAFDTVRARAFADHVILSIEKNRRGEAHLDLEVRKDFSHFRFDPVGSFTADRLHDDLLGVT